MCCRIYIYNMYILSYLTQDILWYLFFFLIRDSVVDFAKLLAEQVDNKLTRHYELDENSKKKVPFISLLLTCSLFLLASVSFSLSRL